MRGGELSSPAQGTPPLLSTGTRSGVDRPLSRQESLSNFPNCRNNPATSSDPNSTIPEIDNKIRTPNSLCTWNLQISSSTALGSKGNYPLDCAIRAHQR